MSYSNPTAGCDTRRACAETISSRITSSVIWEARAGADYPAAAPSNDGGRSTYSTVAAVRDGMYASVGHVIRRLRRKRCCRRWCCRCCIRFGRRLLMEEMDYNLLFRWFVGLNTDDAVWDATVFTVRSLLEADVAQEFLLRVVEQARAKGLTSDEHFTVDGTLLEAWAGAKSFQPKHKQPTPPPDDPGNPTVNFRGEQRSNETHASKTDPDARLARKGEGKESKLSYCGNLLVENRNGLIVDAEKCFRPTARRNATRRW